MSIEAMRQAIEALQGDYGDTKSWHKAIESAIEALRTAIQQADNTACKSVQKRLGVQQPATPEPVGEPFCFASVNKHGDVTSTHKRRDSWRTIPLYTHPAPGVPDDVVRDAERYRWLRSLEHCNEAWCFIGSGNANNNLDAAIDAAMLAAQAQKGEPV